MSALKKPSPPLVRIALGLLLIALAITFNTLSPTTPAWGPRPAPPEISLIENIEIFQQALKQPETALIDARDEFFYAMGHIPGAQSLPEPNTDLPTLELWRSTLAPNPKIIIYCSDEFCHMASELAEKMIVIGLSPTVFKPGFDAWETSGLPVEADEPGL